MNDIVREEWILHDKRLYAWWKSSKMGMHTFIRRHRGRLTEIIYKLVEGDTDDEIFRIFKRYAGRVVQETQRTY